MAATDRGTPASLFNAEFFDQLTEARRARTEAEKAAQIGVNRTTLLRLRKGTHTPNLRDAKRYARALGVSVESLFDLSVDGEAS